MIASMTDTPGRRDRTTDGTGLEARSVNGRNLEIRCRCRRVSTDWRNPAAPPSPNNLKRGNVSLTLTLTSEQQASRCASIARCWPSWRCWSRRSARTPAPPHPLHDGLLRVRGVIEEDTEGTESEEAIAKLDRASPVRSTKC